MNKVVDINTIEQQAADQYLADLCDYWGTLTARRNAALTGNVLLDWIRKTENRDAFSTALIRARIVKQPYTCSELSKTLNISRQAIHVMLEECVENGWIRCFKNGQLIQKSEAKNYVGAMKYDAGDEMLEHGRNFIPLHLKLLEEKMIDKTYENLLVILRAKRMLNGKQTPS